MVVSELSFGCSSLGGVFRSVKEQEAIEAVFTAIECGINLLDVSPYYGYYKAETVLGKALKSIPRDKYYLSTKVGRYGKDGVNIWDYSAKRAKESVYESMERLNIDHIDLINVHDIEFQASLPGGTFICTGCRRLDIKRKVITIGMTVLHFVPGLPGFCHLLRMVGNLIPPSL